MRVLTPRGSIRVFCRQCSGTFLDVKFCSDPDCALWPHRLGTKEAATRKYGAELFNKENFEEGGKFAPPEEATSLEARHFRPIRLRDGGVGPDFRLSGPKQPSTTLEPSKAEI